MAEALAVSRVVYRAQYGIGNLDELRAVRTLRAPGELATFFTARFEERPDARRHRAKLRLNREGFRWLVAPSAAFAALAGLDGDRLFVASNGSDTRNPNIGTSGPALQPNRCPTR